MDYGSNPAGNNLNIIDDKGKKKMDLLQGFRKQEYSSNSGTTNTKVNLDNYESNDNKIKNDFQKFMGMNSIKISSTDNGNSNMLDKINSINLNNKDLLNSIKGKNPENIKVY
jgi:hypothetical protein